MYALVVFHPLQETVADELIDDHRSYVTELIRTNNILLGGEFDGRICEAAHGAYVLYCASIDEARALAHNDPYIAAGAYRADIAQWNLVSINPDAVERDLLHGRGDIV